MRASVKSAVIGTPLEAPSRWLWEQISRVRQPQGWTYDRQALHIMASVLGNRSNCLDVGCHVGSVLRHMIRIAPLGHHIAIEPLPELADLLRRRFPTVELHEVALSDRVGARPFCHVVGAPGYSGLERQPYPRPDMAVREITVDTTTLDELLPPGHRVDLIKVDVEGAELQALGGGRQTIARERPYIIFEHGAAAASYGTTSEAVYDLLVTECGLHISLLGDWLAGGRPLERSQFAAAVGPEYCFLAHP